MRRYDAVTTDGELLWQNALNSSNYPFFDAADAIFINYGWRPPTAAATAAAAGQRRADVYMGVDVFGRGTYGGGGWDSGVGLAAARAEGLSAALFAPGWVLECTPREQFAANQERYWQKVRGGGLGDLAGMTRPQQQGSASTRLVGSTTAGHVSQSWIDTWPH